MSTTLSTPNRIVWDYFLSLRLLEENARKAPSPELSRQAAALAVVMAVTVVEVFLNLWFRVHVEERKVPSDREALLKDISARISLDHKLKQWPKRYLSDVLNLTAGVGDEFMKLKGLRNSIVHFTSSHESIDLGSVTIHGLADTTEYDALSAEKASWALQTAEDLVAELFRLAGISSEKIPHALHSWVGKVPV
jgi:hypothetical protein